MLNVLFWAVVSMGAAWLGTRFPAGRICIDGWMFRQRDWERGGRTYERLLKVRGWKDHLPDWGGVFAGGFSKGRLQSASTDYLERFAAETCRGEAVHWAVMISGPLSLIWNPWWAGMLMVLYGTGANLPCIIVQRYNRIRLLNLLRNRRNDG
ncbi:MAG: hypothetical protein JXA64_02185 [Candidatus Fermentibacteraceae bacterium]|nr:hypothetical protein [Candidatus Fermentibacteraceae bacterium]MBN2607896.1 hypothetical protein [Candidatus Fermentibacteraceae bacterium]